MKAARSKKMKEILADENDARILLRRLMSGKKKIKHKGGLVIKLGENRMRVRQVG